MKFVPSSQPPALISSNSSPSPPHSISFLSIEDVIRRFRYSVIATFPLVLWSNILIIIIMELSTHLQSMLFPLCLHILLTGSLVTLIVQQRQPLFYIQEYSTDQYRYKQLAKKYHSFMFLSNLLLPLLTIVCAISLFHISLDSAFHRPNSSCPNSYLDALQTLNVGGESLVILYSLTLTAILILSCVSNYFAAILASYYTNL